MKYAKLGNSGLQVSRVCLGSMTWGVQNTQQDADQQIHYALEHGVNFIDTAEMYAIPATPDTYGKTEQIIGHWISANAHKRQDVIIASKIAGPGMHWVRDGQPITGEAVIKSVEDSLTRLQTDYIDLYQLHWPNRVSPHFGKQWPNTFTFDEVDVSAHRAQMLEILQALNECIVAGKIRHCGLSDETPWGISTYLELAQKHSLPKMVSIQNEFSLLCQKDWPYLIEHCHHNDVAYLPWSPLATGLLTGKYANNARPQGTRWSLMQPKSIYRNTEFSQSAAAQYCEIAQQIGITPAQLALAWCNQVQGVTSTIIGATHLHQLQENIAAFDIELDEQTLQRINKVTQQFPAPY
ncbi:aldo/keto reductase [Vibrio rarus]|uniref:aldo/keto reductase n=1 Tax=Vibrio rarus TaxID=413403 RepID=UPI0021C34F00|nr:aldo/keto reductase [Vibrio rarus]